MAEFNQFGSARPSQSADAKVCSQFDAMLAEAVDGCLSAEDQAAFDLHLVGCASCRELLLNAKRGAAWMEMLREETPALPAGLLDKILAQTSGAAAAGGLAVMTATAEVGGMPGVPDAGPGSAGVSNLLAFRRRAVLGLGRIDLQGWRHTLLQPRLAMTAAMAFFSIALTLNLTGVRVTDLRVSDLKPSSLKRSMYEANAHVVRYYTNLRVVYEMESRVRDLQRSSDDDLPPSTPVSTPGGTAEPEKTDPGVDGGRNKRQTTEPKRRVNPGTSRREPSKEPVGTGGSVFAALRSEPMLTRTTGLITSAGKEGATA